MATTPVIFQLLHLRTEVEQLQFLNLLLRQFGVVKGCGWFDRLGLTAWAVEGIPALLEAQLEAADDLRDSAALLQQALQHMGCMQ